MGKRDGTESFSEQQHGVPFLQLPVLTATVKGGLSEGKCERSQIAVEGLGLKIKISSTDKR
jgi:hypothetical protein